MFYAQKIFFFKLEDKKKAQNNKLKMNVLSLIGRVKPLLTNDIATFDNELKNLVQNNRFLVIGGAGSIGQAVTKEIFRKNSLNLM